MGRGRGGGVNCRTFQSEVTQGWYLAKLSVNFIGAALLCILFCVQMLFSHTAGLTVTKLWHPITFIFSSGKCLVS